jgi:MFS family permease
MSNYLKRAFSFLGLQKSTSLLFASIVVIGVGEHMWLRFIPKYLEILGATVFIIGLSDFIETVLAAVYGFPGGIVGDRYGLRRCMIFFVGFSILGYIILLIFPSWPAVIIGMFFYLGWSNLSQPALFAFIGKALPSGKHVMGMSLISIVNRIPRTFGPIIGGALVASMGFIAGIRTALMISVICGIAGIILLSRIKFEEKLSTPKLNITGLWREMNRDWKILLLSDILARYCQRIPFAFVILYAINNLGIGAGKFGLLLALEVVVSMLIYIPVANFADRMSKKPFVLATFFFFTLFPIMLYFSANYWLLIIAFIIRGLKEFGEPSRKSLLIALAPETSTASSVGLYYLIRDLIAASGSFVGAWLWSLGPGYNMFTAAAFGAISMIVFIFGFRPRTQMV